MSDEGDEQRPLGRAHRAKLRPLREKDAQLRDPAVCSSRGAAAAGASVLMRRPPAARLRRRRRELDFVARQAHERLLERGLLRRQLVDRRSRARRRRRRSARRSARRTSSAPGSTAVDDRRPAPRAAREAARARGERTSTTFADALRDEIVDARVGDQPAAADHDQVVGGQRHLAHQVRRDEHRATLGGEALAAGCASSGCPPGRGR